MSSPKPSPIRSRRKDGTTTTRERSGTSARGRTRSSTATWCSSSGPIAPRRASDPLGRPAHQDLHQRPHRPAAMRHAMLGGEWRLAEGHSELGREEQGIITEAAGPARLPQDASLARRFDELGLGERRLEIGHHTAIARGPGLIRHGGEPFEQERVVRRLTRSRPVHLRPARREHTRGAVERVYLEPRVVGQGGLTRPLREIARLGDRVLGEARPALEIALVGEPLQEPIRREVERERETGEQIAHLADLALVPCGDEELGGVQRAGPPLRKRARSSVVETSATIGTRTTRPPQPSTWSAPTIASRA